MVYEVSLYPPRRPAQPSLGLIQLPAGRGLHLTTFSSAASLLQAFAFYFRMHPGIYKYSPAPISGGSRDLVPYNRRTGLRHSGLSCVSVSDVNCENTAIATLYRIIAIAMV